MTKWTREKIMALSRSERANLYANAKNLDNDEARGLVTLIEETQIPYSESGGISYSDPLVQKIEQIVFSDEGRKAAVEATEEGKAGIAGVDRLLRAALGADYGAHNMTTNWAGHFVAELMRMSGYKLAGREISTPPGCVARSGELWIKK